MSDGILGHGTTLTGGTAGLIGNITNISVGTITVDPVEISTMDSDDKYREYIPGMVDGGEITFTVNYEETDFATLKGRLDALTAESWAILFPDSSHWACPGFITGLTQNDPFDGVITADITIKISGKPVFTKV